MVQGFASLCAAVSSNKDYAPCIRGDWALDRRLGKRNIK